MKFNESVSSARADARPRTGRGTARTRVTAALISLLVHAAAFTMMFATASGRLVALDGRAAETAGMSVTLVSASALSATSTAPSGGALRPLLAKYESDAAPVEIDIQQPGDDMTRLLRRLSADRTKPSPLEDELRADDARRAADERSSDPAAAAPSGRRDRSAEVSAGAPGSTGGLWGTVAPCWTTISQKSSVPVTLEVALDMRGQLTTPPRIIRNAGARLDEPRLQAEALALSALAACLPRSDLRLSGRVYRLDFPPGS